MSLKSTFLFSGQSPTWEANDQSLMGSIIPEDQHGFARDVIETLADKNSFLELKKVFGRSVITGFIRLEGKPYALIANDYQQLRG